jgi:hypothetical protein
LDKFTKLGIVMYIHMPTPTSPQVKVLKKPDSSRLLTILSLGLVILGTIGLVLFQLNIKKSQDIRDKASVVGGAVVVTTSPTSGTEFIHGEPVTVDLSINTQGTQTDGVQLTLYIEADNIATPTAEILTSSGLQSTAALIVPTDNGYKITFLALSQFGQPFITTTSTTFARISFTTTNTGPIALVFDPATSLSTVFGSDPVQDQLSPMATVNYSVVALASPDESPDPSPTPSPAASPDPSPSPTPTPGASPSPTPTPGVGGGTIKQCNESCSSNAECDVNHYCYTGKCRLVTNPTNTACVNPPDQGLSFGCNHYCANTGECASGYSCLENRCRRADNPDDTQCRLPSSTTQQSIAASCNKTCTTNAQCAANLRCYQGACRLATNPTSASCGAAISTASPTLKGGLDDKDSATLSATRSTTAKVSPKPSVSPTVSPKPVAESEPGEQSLLSSLLNKLSLRVLGMIAIGFGLLILVLLLLSRLMRRRPSPVRGPVSAPQAPPTTTSDTQYEQELQAKLNALKQQEQSTAPPSAMTPPPTTMTTAPMETPVAASPVEMPVEPTVEPTAETPQPETPVFTRNSSMMERVKEKGINPPSSDSSSNPV